MNWSHFITKGAAIRIALILGVFAVVFGWQMTTEMLRVVSFVCMIALVYYLALSWCTDRVFHRTPRTRFARFFQSRIAGAVLLGCAALGMLCIAYGFFVEPYGLTVTTYRIETSKIPRGEQVRVVQLADLHVRGNGSRERELPELVRSLEPDLIVYTGDFFGIRGVEANVVQLLKSWSVPQYACRGNLDVMGDFNGVLREAGVKALGNARDTIAIRGARLTLAGFAGYPGDRTPDVLKELPRDTLNIVLCHYPGGFPATWGTAADLMLAGHIHGGQIRLPWYGALMTLDPSGKRWEYGLYEEHCVKLIVSRGIGCEPHVPEVRFLCPPEVVVVDIVGVG